mmetsp:Transcript_53203/g.153548  ORF Transcript_53203/g.153548 Transcript_53203/m.153548 type:complete len:214 (-) Transcript_53203:461-1102(-)
MTRTSGVAVRTGSGIFSSGSPKLREVDRNIFIFEGSGFPFCNSRANLLSARGPTRQMPLTSLTTMPPAFWIRFCSSARFGRWSSEMRNATRPRNTTARQSPHQATKSLATPPRAWRTVPGCRSSAFASSSLGFGHSAAQPRRSEGGAFRGTSKPWARSATMAVLPSMRSFFRACTNQALSTVSKASVKAPEIMPASCWCDTLTRFPSLFARAL